MTFGQSDFQTKMPMSQGTNIQSKLERLRQTYRRLHLPIEEPLHRPSTRSSTARNTTTHSGRWRSWRRQTSRRRRRRRKRRRAEKRKMSTRWENNSKPPISAPFSKLNRIQFVGVVSSFLESLPHVAQDQSWKKIRSKPRSETNPTSIDAKLSSVEEQKIFLMGVTLQLASWVVVLAKLLVVVWLHFNNNKI